MTDIYAVVGNPISHSKSPKIHTLFAEQTKQDLFYKAELVELGEFNDHVGKFLKFVGTGVNVTVPFKEDAFLFADTHTERAKRAGAVNTLKKMPDGSILADNTDGAGLVRDITVNNQVSISGKRVLLLGAGGAVRGVLQPILAENPTELIIANRTISKAESLAADFADSGNVKGAGFSDVEGSFDVIINGTSASLSGELPPLPLSIFKNGTVTYDMMYGAERTVFNQWAFENGVSQTIDGLGMLIEQAAEAFFLWRGVRPDTAPVLEIFRQERRK